MVGATVPPPLKQQATAWLCRAAESAGRWPLYLQARMSALLVALSPGEGSAATPLSGVAAATAATSPRAPRGKHLSSLSDPLRAFASAADAVTRHMPEVPAENRLGGSDGLLLLRQLQSALVAYMQRLDRAQPSSSAQARGSGGSGEGRAPQAAGGGGRAPSAKALAERADEVLHATLDAAAAVLSAHALDPDVGGDPESLLALQSGLIVVVRTRAVSSTAGSVGGAPTGTAAAIGTAAPTSSAAASGILSSEVMSFFRRCYEALLSTSSRLGEALGPAIAPLWLQDATRAAREEERVSRSDVDDEGVPAGRVVYTQFHKAMAQLFFLMTGEKLGWQDPSFGAAVLPADASKQSAAAPASLQLEPLKAVPLQPLTMAPAPPLLLGSGQGTLGSAEEHRCLMLWCYAEPLLRAYVLGRGDWQKQQQQEDGGAPVVPPELDMDSALSGQLKGLLPLIDRWLVGIAPPEESVVNGSAAVKSLEGFSLGEPLAPLPEGLMGACEEAVRKMVSGGGGGQAALRLRGGVEEAPRLTVRDEVDEGREGSDLVYRRCRLESMRVIQAGIPPCLAHLAKPSTSPPSLNDEEMVQMDAEPLSSVTAAAVGLEAARSDAHRLLYFLATRARSYDLGVSPVLTPVHRCPLPLLMILRLWLPR